MGLFPSSVILLLCVLSRSVLCDSLQPQGLPCSPPEDLPNPGIRPGSPTLQVDSLPTEPPGICCRTLENHTTMWNFILHIHKRGIFRFGLYSCFEDQIRGMGRCFKDIKFRCHLSFENQKSSEDWCSCPLWLIEDLFETCGPIWFKRNLSGTYSGMATNSCILAWRIPWTEEPGGLQFMGSQRVRHNWSDLACMHALCI